MKSPSNYLQNKFEHSKFCLLFKRNIKYIFYHLKSFIKSVHDDYIAAFASEAALFMMISFFPFCMLLLILLRYTLLTPSFFLRLINDSMPTAVNNYLEFIFDEIFLSSPTVLSVTIIAAIWSASRGFLAIIKGFNVIYKSGETRNYFILRFFSILYTIGFVLMLILTMLLLVFGNKLYHWIILKFTWVTDIAVLIKSIRATILLVTLFIFFLIMYIVLPNRKTKYIYEIPGAFISSSGWLAFSYGYAYYIDGIEDFSRMYGSLTAIVLLMLWMYFCMYILFVGAEVNVLFSKGVIRRMNRKKRRT